MVTRVALVGGDGRQARRWDGAVVQFRAPRDGGNGELRRVLSALRSGRYGRVIILAQWNAHSATVAIRRLCRQLGIPFEVVR